MSVVKVNDTLKELTASYVKVGDVWKEILFKYLRRNGEWKLLIPNTTLYYAGQPTYQVNLGTQQSPNYVFYSLFDVEENGYGAEQDLGDHIIYEEHVKAFDSLDAKIIDLSTSQGHALFIDSKRRLLGCGLNESGQLGLGDIDNRPTPTIINDTLSWRYIHASNNRSFAITDDGDLYAAGDNTQTVLGLGTGEGSYVDVFTKVSGSSWGMVSCQLNATVALRTNGDLYSWGSSANALLGYDTGGDSVSTPTQIGGDTWNYFSMRNHVVAIRSDNNKLYAWGNNSNGSFGEGSEVDELQITPKEIGGENVWKDVFVTLGVTIAIRRNGDMYSTGNGASGATGQNTSSNTYGFTQIGSHKWKRFAPQSSLPRSLAMAEREDGKFFIWGTNLKGSMGFGNQDDILYVPTEFPVPFEIGSDEGKILKVGYDSAIGPALPGAGWVLTVDSGS